MDKKIILLVVVVIVIMFSSNFKKEAAFTGEFSFSTTEACINLRDGLIGEPDWGCIMPCVPISSSIQTCIETCSSGYTILNYGFIAAGPTCAEGYVGNECLFDCLYSGYEATYTCSETDGGIDAPNQGSTTNAYGVTVTDYCSTNLFEYYCESNMQRVTTVTCSDTCSSGACTPMGCSIYGDTFPACDGISRTELGAVAAEWMANPTSALRASLGAAAQNWMDNGGPA